MIEAAHSRAPNALRPHASWCSLYKAYDMLMLQGLQNACDARLSQNYKASYMRTIRLRLKATHLTTTLRVMPSKAPCVLPHKQ